MTTYVNSQATAAKGVKTSINGVHIGETTPDGIPIPEVDTDDIEVTNNDSGEWKEYIPGRKDGGDCEIKANAVDGDEGQIALLNAYKSGETVLIRNDFPSGSYQSFYAIVKTFDHTIDNDLVMLSSKIKVSGEVTFSSSPSALTGLTIDTQTLSPTFDAAKFKYICSVATGVDSVKVLPVQAATGAAITVKGASVTSGNTGNVTTALGAAGTITDIDVVVKEADKAGTVYNIVVYRA